MRAARVLYLSAHRQVDRVLEWVLRWIVTPAKSSLTRWPPRSGVAGAVAPRYPSLVELALVARRHAAGTGRGSAACASFCRSPARNSLSPSRERNFQAALKLDSYTRRLGLSTGVGCSPDGRKTSTADREWQRLRREGLIATTPVLARARSGQVIAPHTMRLPDGPLPHRPLLQPWPPAMHQVCRAARGACHLNLPALWLHTSTNPSRSQSGEFAPVWLSRSACKNSWRMADPSRCLAESVRSG